MPRPALATLLAVVSSACIANPALQDLGSIESAVRARVSATVAAVPGATEIVVGRLDPRLRLPRCDHALETRQTPSARGSGAQSVEVRCTGHKPWSLYVPVTVARYAEVMVTARPIARGETLAAADLIRARRRIDGTADAYFTTAEHVVGQVARRALADGEIVARNQLVPPRLVRRGDRVVLSAGSVAMNVVMQGEALSDGAAGERIRVRNLSSSRVVEGTVDAAGVIVVTTRL